jgi:uncharacterized repeat protein (TIGR02543 family)
MNTNKTISFEWGALSLFCVGLFFMFQIISAEASVESAYNDSSVVAANASTVINTGSANSAKYALTVSNGTGSDVYASGTSVDITAVAPKEGEVFDKWTGDTRYLSDSSTATTTVTMPSKVVVLTATYKDVDTKYALTVSNGTGSDVYASGTSVNITAIAPTAGKVFDKWTGDTDYISDANAAATTVTIPSKEIVLTATYKDAGTEYTLTVSNGTGSASYVSGTEVNITAIAPTAGKVFDKWTGDTNFISNVTAPTTTVKMPSNDVAITAIYKDAGTEYALTVSNGTGSDVYASGTSVNITAVAPAEGKIFDKWTGDTDFISDITAPATTVTMPSKTLVLTATFKNADANALTVSNGTGSALYISGSKITITAVAPAEGKIFDKWTGDTDFISDATAPTTIVTMPFKAVFLTATYKDIEQ